MVERLTCPECSAETEFVQFAEGGEETVRTTAEEVGDGILELRYCPECNTGSEIVLEASTVTTIEPGENRDG